MNSVDPFKLASEKQCKFVSHSRKLITVSREGKYGILTLEGNFVCEPKYDKVYEDILGDDNYVLVENEGKWGYIDCSGEEVIPPKFSRASHFKGDYALVSEGDKVGLIDKQGNYVIEPRYDYLSPIDLRDKEAMIIAELEGKWGAINLAGEILIPYKFDHIKHIVEAGEAAIFANGCEVAMLGGKWGAIDRKGEVVVPFIYDEMKRFSEDFAAVKVGERWGYINEEGEMVIEPKFTTAKSFRNKIAFVQFDNDQHLYEVDPLGNITEWVAPEEYDIYDDDDYNE